MEKQKFSVAVPGCWFAYYGPSRSEAVAGLGHLVSLPKPRSLPLPGATKTGGGGMGPQWEMSRRLSVGGGELSWEEY